MTTLIIATRNRHKVEEIRAILGGDFEYHDLGDFLGAPKVVEDAPTFAGNATKKAVELARWISAGGAGKQPGERAFVLADDSGLEVDALGGAPGVHSARFAATDKSSGNSADADNNAKLLRLLAEVPKEKRTARFRCVLALTPVLSEAAQSNASPVCSLDELALNTETFDGACEGWIDFAPHGKGGFGYDPLFIPEGHTESFAELGEEIKNRLSHRARALEKLRARLHPAGMK